METTARTTFNGQTASVYLFKILSCTLQRAGVRKSLIPNADRARSRPIVEGGSTPYPAPLKRSGPKRVGALLLFASFVSLTSSAAPIDRHALVTRHNAVLHQFDSNNPLTVG